LGKEVLIYPGVKIYPNCSIGDRSIVHANAVIGSDGFGYHGLKDGSFAKIPQIGAVRIDEDVEIGANTVVDRSTVGYTHIAKGVKLDNLVQVAHNVEIGAHTVIAAQTGISGSVTIGKSCVVGGQSAFIPHVRVADGSMFQGKSAVTRDIKESGGKYFGAPAFAFNDYIRSYAIFKQLPAMEKKIRELEKVINDLKKGR
jgi:UDP-3-O-[3-hydroxymyristoyl] glucosamine N-acyltransferase